MVRMAAGMDKALAKQIGEAARESRKARGLTQADVAERVGVSVEFYARLERGGTLPSVPTLRRLASALSTSTDRLLAPSVALPPEKPVSAEAPVTERDRLLRRVHRRLDDVDETTLGIVNQLLIGVTQLRDEWNDRQRANTKRR